MNQNQKNAVGLSFDEINLIDILAVLAQYKRLILITFAAIFILGAVHVFTKSPMVVFSRVIELPTYRPVVGARQSNVLQMTTYQAEVATDFYLGSPKLVENTDNLVWYLDHVLYPQKKQTVPLSDRNFWENISYNKNDKFLTISARMPLKNEDKFSTVMGQTMATLKQQLAKRELLLKSSIQARLRSVNDQLRLEESLSNSLTNVDKLPDVKLAVQSQNGNEYLQSVWAALQSTALDQGHRAKILLDAKAQVLKQSLHSFNAPKFESQVTYEVVSSSKLAQLLVIMVLAAFASVIAAFIACAVVVLRTAQREHRKNEV